MKKQKKIILVLFVQRIIICVRIALNNHVTDRYVKTNNLYSIKCCAKGCGEEYDTYNLERQLSPEMLDSHLRDMCREDRVQGCPFCSYFEISISDSIVNYFYCKNYAVCGKRSCAICFKEVIDYTPQEKAERIKQGKHPKAHFDCLECDEIKKEWDDIIEKGSKRFCPTCGTGGVKNDDCTHITCYKCEKRFCYVCGVSEVMCDKDKSKSNIFGHNINWKTNSNRCPMLHFIKNIKNKIKLIII